MQLNFLREGLNVLAGLILATLGYALTLIAASITVAINPSFTPAIATAVEESVFVLVLAAGFFSDIGGQAFGFTGPRTGQ